MEIFTIFAEVLNIVAKSMKDSIFGAEILVKLSFEILPKLSVPQHYLLYVKRRTF